MLSACPVRLPAHQLDSLGGQHKTDRNPISTGTNILTRYVGTIIVTTAKPDRSSSLAQTDPDPSPELLNALESDTETVTGAIAAGTVTLEEVAQFVRRAERGEIDIEANLDAVVRIVHALLCDEPSWANMEPAGSPVRA